MDFFRGRGAEGEQMPSEIKSAINIALFQAQQTYMAAMDTELAEYKAMFRQEMLTFMAQIRETVQIMYSVDPVPSEKQQFRALLELPTDLMAKETESLVNGWHNEALKSQQVREPMLTLASPPPEAAQETQAHQNSQQVDEQRRPMDGTPGFGTATKAESRPDPDKDPEHKPDQLHGAKVVRNFQLLIMSRTKHWSWLQGRIRKMQWHTRFYWQRVRGADTVQAGKHPETDPVVEALYRPRTGGGKESRSAVRVRDATVRRRSPVADATQPRMEEQLVYVLPG